MVAKTHGDLTGSSSSACCFVLPLGSQISPPCAGFLLLASWLALSSDSRYPSGSYAPVVLGSRLRRSLKLCMYLRTRTRIPSRLRNHCDCSHPAIEADNAELAQSKRNSLPPSSFHILRLTFASPSPSESLHRRMRPPDPSANFASHTPAPPGSTIFQTSSPRPRITSHQSRPRAWLVTTEY